MAFKIYSSTDSFGNYIKDKSILGEMECEVTSLVESDSIKPKTFYKLPKKLRDILALDCPDAIITFNDEPVLVIEDSREAGTGHNAFQRFPRMVASLEHHIPYIYIYPEAAIVDRENAAIKWDPINPLIFKAMISLREIHNTPAMLFYYPSYYKENKSIDLDKYPSKGLKIDSKYLGCPDSNDTEIISLFELINEYLSSIFNSTNLKDTFYEFNKSPKVRERIDFLHEEFIKKANNKDWNEMSPLTATLKIPTNILLDYLSTYEKDGYQIGSLLRSRENTIIYLLDAKFRGDPYPGCVAAIDYLICRSGEEVEQRTTNLVMIWGDFSETTITKISVKPNGKSTITDFINEVKSSERKNLLNKNYNELESSEIPRYFMHLQEGTRFTKSKHLRVYSYFLDAIIFPDGALWRDS